MRLLTPVVTTSFTLELYSTWALCRIFCSQQIHRTEISPLGIKIFLTKMVDSAELLLSSQKYQEAKRQTSNHKSPSEPSPPVRTLSKLCHSWKKSGLKRRGRKLTLTEVLTAMASLSLSEEGGTWRSALWILLFLKGTWKSTFSVWTINANRNVCKCAWSHIIAAFQQILHILKKRFLFLFLWLTCHNTTNTSCALGTVYSQGHGWN